MTGTRDGDGPRPKDRVNVEFAADWVGERDGHRIVDIADGLGPIHVQIPAWARVDVVERADDPSQDEIGTVRREEHREDGGHSAWQHIQFQLSDTKAGSHWVCTHSDHFGNLGESLTHAQVRGMPVVGAAPGTPAAEAWVEPDPDDLVHDARQEAARRAVRHRQRSGCKECGRLAAVAEAAIDHSRPSVRVVNEPHGPSVEDRRRIVEFLGLGDKVRAVLTAATAGLDREQAEQYVESMSEYQSYLSEHGETREPRVFQSDGPEPPADVVALRDPCADSETEQPYLVRDHGGWRWSPSPELVKPDCGRFMAWRKAAGLASGHTLVEVLPS